MPRSTLNIYKTLDPEQLQFANTKKVDAILKMKRWFDFMVPVALMDKNNDESRRKKKTVIGFTIAGMVISLIITFAFLPFLIVLIGLTIILVVNISRMNFLKKLDIGNHLRLFLMPFLVIIKEECNEQSKARIKFDASNPINPAKITNTLRSTNKGLPQVTTTIYEHPWLDAEFVLADGTGLQMEFGDTVLHKHVKKRGSSGKIKYKTKRKIKHHLQMKFSFSKNNYSLAKVNKAYQHIDLPEHHIFKVKHKLYSDSVDKSIRVEEVLNMIAGAYQNVKPIS
jgi:hypothetical protein